MRLHLLAHNNENFVKIGDKVEAYKTKTGSIGVAGGYFAHLHHSISENLTEDQLIDYVDNWTKEEVEKYYENPAKTTDYDLMFGRQMDVGNLGYGWLDRISTGGFHPGQDINGFGGGNTDLGYEYTSPVSGEVIEAKDFSGAWGNVIIIKEETMSGYHITSELEDELKELDPTFNGDSKESQKKMAKIIDKLTDKVEDLVETYEEIGK